MKIATKIIVPVLLIIAFSGVSLAVFSRRVEVEDDLIKQKHREARRIDAVAGRLDRLQAELGFHLLSSRFGAEESHRSSVAALETEIQDLITEALALPTSRRGRRLIGDFEAAWRGVEKIQADLLESVRQGDEDQAARPFKSWALKDVIARATLRDLVVFADLDETRVLEEISSRRAAWSSMIFTVFALTAVLGAVAVGYYVKAVVAPLRQVTEVAESIARGDLEQRADAVERTDEIGALARAFNTMLAGLEAGEEELKKVNEGLRESQKRLRDQRQELWQANAELERTSGYKSEFLANMSHELRTPLSSLLILSQALADNKDGNLDAKQVEFAQIIHGSGVDLLESIDGILDLSKIEAGRLELEIEALDPRQVIQGLYRELRHLAADKGLEFRLEIGADLPAELVTDARRLRQILKNLVSNAVKFTAAGSITLALDRPRAVDRSLQGIPRPLRFAVIDTGIGIPQAERQNIFEAFRQADGTIARKFGGTGLGLSISLALTRLLGGQLRLHSEEDRGSRFELLLPATFETPAEEQLLLALAVAAPPTAAPHPALEPLADDGAEISPGDLDR